MMRARATELLIGVFFGFALSRIGFSAWDEVHRMFAFQDLRLLFTFMVAVALLFAAFFVIKRREGALPARLFHRGNVMGGVMFGVGWALTGACPSIAWVQLGEGQLGALATLAGIFVGNWLYGTLNERVLHMPAQSCAND